MFDLILTGFVTALTTGFAALHIFSMPLLAVVAHLAWLRGTWPCIRSGVQSGEVFAHAILMLISIVIYVFLVSNLHSMALLVFTLAAQLGAMASGGSVSVDTLLHPQSIFLMGLTAATPIQDFLARLVGWTAIKNIHNILNYTIAYMIIAVAFAGLAFNIALTIIEFHFALLCATVLVPWAPLAGTAFLAEFSLAWLIGMIVRVFIQTAVVGMSLPLFAHLVLTATPGGDPDFWGAVMLTIGSVFFFLLSWIIPNRAVAIAGRGMALGIGGDALIAGMQSAARGVRGAMSGATTVVMGASRMIQNARTA